MTRYRSNKPLHSLLHYKPPPITEEMYRYIKALNEKRLAECMARTLNPQTSE